MPDFAIESGYPDTHRIAGVDEAGRGPWAGSVVAAAVIFPSEFYHPPSPIHADSLAWVAILNDSKKLSAKRREELFDTIMQHAMVGVGEASATEIDTLNIWGATQLAMRRAVAALPQLPDAALVDGKLIPKQFPCPAHAIVKGDSVSYSIAAASIIAKVTRDRIMHALAEQYPQYGFERHAGYGTAYHLNAIREHGPCPAHRRSWPLHKVWKQAA